jgi:hypothetical protein
MTFDAFPWRRCAAVVAAALGLSLGVALPATADPKGDPFEIQCDGLGSLQIVVNGNGSDPGACGRQHPGGYPLRAAGRGHVHTGRW